jgi:hypothetical protein
MRVSQSVEIVWVFDVEYSPLSLFHSREKLLLTFPQTFRQRHIVFTLGNWIQRDSSHQKWNKDDASFWDCSSVSTVLFVCVWEPTKRKGCLSRFQALAIFPILDFMTRKYAEILVDPNLLVSRSEHWICPYPVLSKWP